MLITYWEQEGIWYYLISSHLQATTETLSQFKKTLQSYLDSEKWSLGEM